MRTLLRVGMFGCIAAGAVAAWAQSDAVPAAPQVRTVAGMVEGKASAGVTSFLGIPYAAPPVGDLRWKPPVPPAKWDGVRKTTGFGSRCMQAPVYGDMVFRDPGVSEDCLTLNVWMPGTSAANPAKLPVMVWIYGGGYQAGSTSEQRQDGFVLAQQGVVVVSMNYRLGVFGFFTHPELAKESGHNSAGNYGLLDQTAALHWVQDNIAGFGGDAKNVTIFGESAGSFSVSALMASPLAKGLFQKAIGESGAAFSKSGLVFQPLTARETKDAKVASDRLHLSALADLRALPPQKLIDAFFQPNGKDNVTFDACVDGYFLPQLAAELFAAGQQNDVPLLAGWNRDEGSFEVVFAAKKPTRKSVQAIAKTEFGAEAKNFLRLYPVNSDAQAFRSMEDFAGDSRIAWAAWRWMEAQSKTGKQPIYRYRFDTAPPLAATEPQLGAYHSAEIEYVFGQLDSKANVDWRPEDRALSALMQKYWTNFARSGDPNADGLPKWPVYKATDGWQVMHLTSQPEARKDELRDRYVFLSSVWAK